MAEPPTRAMPHVNVRKLVRNHSTRHGATVSLIVVHDTEGANIPGSVRDLQGLAGWFDNPAAQASSHVATDGDGNSARFVRDEDKAWHVAFYNPVSLGIEQVGFASQKQWPAAQQAETARWIAYWSHLHGVPIRKGRVSRDGRVLRSGVVRHSDLGFLGGNHNDPGPAYPLHDVLVLARGFVKRM
jgi:N-acetyl-anhydromuramyl-L-alanine amidase AmpD